MQGQEQRLTTRLLKHWDTIRKTNSMPEREHFNHEPIADLWKQCFLVSVDTHGALNYKYDYIGDAITTVYGRDLTGHVVDGTQKKFPGVIMYQKFAEIVAEHRPKEDSGYFLSENGKLIKYRACFLPFGNDKKGITHIVVGLSFRQF